MLRGASWLLAVLFVGCVRPVRVETRETPVETGLEVPFVADGVRRWDFGDGSAPVSSAQLTHAFSKAGRYVVRGFEGEALREQVTLIVSPRGVFHLVPPDVKWAVMARGLEDLPPAVDFAERLVGAASTQNWLERYPLHGWALDQATAGAQWVDPREGLAYFAWDDSDEVRLSVVGVTSAKDALAALETWLLDRGWNFVSEVQGLARFEQEERALDLFVDRGALYAVDAPLTRRQPGVQQRIAAAPSLGLEQDGKVASALDQLPSGALVVWARAPVGAAWLQLAGTVRLSGDEAHLEARLIGAAPLWTVPPSEGPRLLSHAPEGPIAAAVASIAPRQLADLVLGTEGTPRRKGIHEDLSLQGAELERALDGLAGTFDATLYVDVESFVRKTIEAGGRPQPQATLLFEAAVKDRAPVEALLDAWVRRWQVPVTKSVERQLRLWRGSASGRRVEIALTHQALFAQSGASVGSREPADLTQSLGTRFEGAFGPGHVSVFFDVGQLRRELLTPRLMDDVDPRNALTAQALAVTVLDRLTQLDLALFDASPTADGAAIQAVVRLRAKD